MLLVGLKVGSVTLGLGGLTTYLVQWFLPCRMSHKEYGRRKQGLVNLVVGKMKQNMPSAALQGLVNGINIDGPTCIWKSPDMPCKSGVSHSDSG